MIFFIFTRAITGLEMNFVGKNYLFFWVIKYMGGEPLDRSGGMNKVDSIAAIFSRRKVFVLPWLRNSLASRPT
jgi:hypothetical protein